MDPVVISGPGFGPVSALHARRFRDRLVGMQSDHAGKAMLIDASSVHTFGLGRPIGVVGLDRGGGVVASRIVGRNRVVWLRRAVRVLELDADMALPLPGQVLEVRRG